VAIGWVVGLVVGDSVVGSVVGPAAGAAWPIDLIGSRTNIAAEESKNARRIKLRMTKTFPVGLTASVIGYFRLANSRNFV
jgi:hypothetical protein